MDRHIPKNELKGRQLLKKRGRDYGMPIWMLQLRRSS